MDSSQKDIMIMPMFNINITHNILFLPYKFSKDHEHHIYDDQTIMGEYIMLTIFTHICQNSN